MYDVCIYARMHLCMCTPTVSARFFSAAVSCMRMCVCMCMVMCICTCVRAPARVCGVSGGDGSTYSQNIFRQSCQVFCDTRGVDTFVIAIQIREFVGVGTGIGVGVGVGITVSGGFGVGVGIGVAGGGGGGTQVDFDVGVDIGVVLLEKFNRLFLPQN